MATNTTRTFSSMLHDYLPNSLLREEMIKRDWFLTNVKKDNNWMGGDIQVPFEAAHASSIKFGGLTAANAISEYNYVKGSITAYKEVWGSLLFYETDLMQHGKLSEQNFLKQLPDQIDHFLNYMKEAVSINLMSGPHFAKMTADSDLANGIFEVDRIDRFSIGQEFDLDDDNSSETTVYVIAIDVGLKRVTVSASRGGAAANVSAYTTAQNAKCYHPGIYESNTPTNHFVSLRSALLSAANGGSSTLHGQTKTAYPFLQAVNISGSSVTSANILDELFDAITEYRTRAKGGNADKIVMSYKHLGSIMKLIEIQKGSFNVRPGDTRVNQYGWTEIDITSVKGALTIVGIQEADDDVIFGLDMRAFTLRSNGLFKKRRSPDGIEYYETRAATGYNYIVDLCLFGELEVTQPALCWVMYGISY